MQPKSAAEQTKELSAEQRLRLDQVNLKSLSLCIGMLERVDSVSRCIVTFNFLTTMFSSRLLKRMSLSMVF
jgi:hypothetical protein